MSATAPQPEPCSDPVRDQQLAAAAMWARMLQHVPTLLGRLVSVASFRVGASGEYRHATLDRVFSPQVANRVLRESHEHLFAEWVGLFLEEQSEDLQRYLSSLPKESARDLLLAARESLIPSSTNAVVRRAFHNDLEQILGLEQPESGVPGNPRLAAAFA